jgi:hypothetical protein
MPAIAISKMKIFFFLMKFLIMEIAYSEIYKLLINCF